MECGDRRRLRLEHAWRRLEERVRSRLLSPHPRARVLLVPGRDEGDEAAGGGREGGEGGGRGTPGTIGGHGGGVGDGRGAGGPGGGDGGMESACAQKQWSTHSLQPTR